MDIARDLLGKLLVREVGERRFEGRVVEVEAYCGPEDRAAHSSRGRTPRTEVMFGPPGHIYVYLIYGMYNCLNFVTAPVGRPQAVLIRALEPVVGVARCSGPGLLCRAFEIDRSLNGAPIGAPGLDIVEDGYSPGPIHALPRIGVDYAGEWAAQQWRFCLESPHLSRPLPG